MTMIKATWKAGSDGHLETQQQRPLGPVPVSPLPGLLAHVSLLDVLCVKVTETL